MRGGSLPRRFTRIQREWMWRALANGWATITELKKWAGVAHHTIKRELAWEGPLRPGFQKGRGHPWRKVNGGKKQA